MLTVEQERKLNRIKNRRTLYETILTNGEKTYLFCYTGRRSRGGLVEILRKRIDDIEKIVGMNFIEKHSLAWKAVGEKWYFIGTKWEIRFSRRTHRQCILEGELQYVGDVSAITPGDVL